MLAAILVNNLGSADRLGGERVCSAVVARMASKSKRVYQVQPCLCPASTDPTPQAAAETVGLLLRRLEGQEGGERLGQVVRKRMEKMASSKSTEEKDR